MKFTCWWQILLFGLWIQACIVPVIDCKDGTIDHLSREADVLFVKDDQDPKCFTRTLEDFICFFEAPDNRTYDFFYMINRWKRCELSVQRTEEGTLLHVCSFPGSDVPLYVDINLEVVEHQTNTSLYSRTVCVEHHILLDAPFNVSLQQNGKVGQLKVSWLANLPKYSRNNIFKIRVSSKGLGEKVKQIEVGSILDSLIPGEEVTVQVAAKTRISGEGHWSRWSQPVRAVVPQSADDISLVCYTSDLQSIICQWNGSRYADENEYTLFYKMNHGNTSAQTEWTECLTDRDLIDLCQFRVHESTEFRVKLSSSPAPFGRTFYTQGFTLNKIIKTIPPNHLKSTMEKGKLCVKWEAPLPSLAAHLEYEVDFQIRGGDKWTVVLSGVAETSVCQVVPTSSQFGVKVRAKPSDSFYSGMWSDWSPVLTGETPAAAVPDTLLLLCIPVSLLIIAIVVITLSPTYLSKLKLYFWPPVPNLDKVLQGFLTEINGERWNSPLAIKQCFEDAPPSVVEIMSEDEVSGLERPSEESKQLLSADRGLCGGESTDRSTGSEAFPDYVTLNKNSGIHIPQGNGYVEEQHEGREAPVVKDTSFQTCHTSCSGCSVCIPPCLVADFLNQSYLPQAECADTCICKVSTDRSPGNLYTNFPCS